MNFISNFFSKIWLSKPRKIRGHGKRKSVRPKFDLLEDRTLLQGGPWSFLGPMPQTDPSVILANSPPSEGLDQNYSGRVAALATSTNYDGWGTAALYVGSASGGVWRSDLPTPNNGNFTVSWQPLPVTGNNLPAGLNNSGALAVDPNNLRRIYAGTGEANFSGDFRRRGRDFKFNRRGQLVDVGHGDCG